MAQGYIDPNSGTWIYDSDDAQQPVRDLLNRLAHSVRDVVRDLLERVSAVEGRGAVFVGGMEAKNGYSIDPQSGVMKLDDMCFVQLSVAKSAVDAVVCATLPAGARPGRTITLQGTASGGSAASVVVTIATSGDVRIWSASATNTRVDINTFFMAA